MNDEVKMRRGRPPKPRRGILSAEQILAIRGDAPPTLETVEEAAERREAERQRGIARRAQAKFEKQVEGIETKEAFWALNRSLIPADELSALLVIQERVFDIVHWCNEKMQGTGPAEDDELFVRVENGTAGLKDFVEEHGITSIELILLDQYWKNADLYQRFQGTDPDSIFARLGIVIGFPAHKLHQFEEWLDTRSTTTLTATTVATGSSGNGYTTLKCSIPDCTSWPAAVQESIAAEYREKNIPYRCGRCVRLEHLARNDSTIVKGGAHLVYGRGGSL